jgi:hypothetical protein
MDLARLELTRIWSKGPMYLAGCILVLARALAFTVR